MFAGKCNCLRILIMELCVQSCLLVSSAQEKAPQPTVSIAIPRTVNRQPITGRMLVMISKTDEPEVRFQVSWLNSPQVFGMDVYGLAPGQGVTLDKSAVGCPFDRLEQIPPGDYYVQALLNVYTEFYRADGQVIWAHMDQGEGQNFNRSPGNLYGKVQKIHLDGSRTKQIKLSLTEEIPPVTIPPDTEWVKHIKVKSALLSKFWGRPMYLGAVVLLPKDYENHADVDYPVVYQQGHFSEKPPFEFSIQNLPERIEDRQERLNLGFETGYEFYQSWSAAQFPRMIAVSFQHPTPYYDDSYAVNSANAGPYGDAIMTELIPYLEEHFRTIRQPYARVLTGGSTGGWEALALQLFYAKFFGGAWVLYPDPVDFRSYGLVNIYEDDNAFVPPLEHDGSWQQQNWAPPPRFFARRSDGQPIITNRRLSQLELVLGNRARSGGQLGVWEATFGPVGQDGYPKPLWDMTTGKIDHDVANYMRQHGYDLRYFAETNWSKIGPDLVGKLHFNCGDMDSFYLNLATYRFEEFAEQTKEPYYDGAFVYGRPEKGHGWQQMTNAEMIRTMASYVKSRAPKNANSAWENQ